MNHFSVARTLEENVHQRKSPYLVNNLENILNIQKIKNILKTTDSYLNVIISIYCICFKSGETIKLGGIHKIPLAFSPS